MQKIFVSNIFAKRFVSKYIYENSYSSVIKQSNQKVGKISEYTFHQRNMKASNHMKRCSTSLVIRKMQIKTTLRYYYISTKIAVIKNG